MYYTTGLQKKNILGFSAVSPSPPVHDHNGHVVPVKPFDLASAMAQGSAPVCNTGAQSAEQSSSLLEIDTTSWKHKGFLIDWLRFVCISPEAQGHFLTTWRGDDANWIEQDSGHMGYRRCYRNGRLSIYFDHAQEGRGICIDISGKGCRQLEADGVIAVGSGWMNLLHKLTTTPGCHITRLDCALDDRDGILHLGAVKSAINEGRVVSRFKTAYEIEKKSLSTGCGFGTTVNFGSRISDIMVRMYDKAAQTKTDGHWTRMEIEAKDEHAVKLAEMLVAADLGCEGAVVAGVLRNYVDFKEFGTQKQRCRWPSCAWWLRFVEWAEKLRLAVPKQEPSLERAKNWLRRQCAPSIALVYRAAGSVREGKQEIYDLLTDGEKRFRPKHHEILRKEKAYISSRRGLLANPGASVTAWAAAPGATGF